jgi:OFA family oxalate/formate antiporter-like MFS transporter
MALVYFTWGEIYSIFPAISADFFGARNASSNYSIFYSSKGAAAFPAIWLAARLFEKTGTWTVVFYGSAALASITAIMAAGLIAIPLPTKQKDAAVIEKSVKTVES